MDTLQDFIETSREETVGANEPDFIHWLEFNGLKLEFHPRFYAIEKQKVIDALKAAFWADYLDDCEYAMKAEKEAKLFA